MSNLANVHAHLSVLKIRPRTVAALVSTRLMRITAVGGWGRDELQFDDNDEDVGELLRR